MVLLYMKRVQLQRVWAALIVLSVIAGLPIQGTAMTMSDVHSSITSPANMTASTMDDCDGCNQISGEGMLCPMVFCIGQSGIVFETPDIAQPLLERHNSSVPTSAAGLSVIPDPSPPRAFLQAKKRHQ